MSVLFFELMCFFLFQGNSEAVPLKSYDSISSGFFPPISEAVPVYVHKRKTDKRRTDAENTIIRAIRARMDKIDLSELESIIHNDILQNGLSPPECRNKYGIRDGVLKHTIRGTRNIVGALLRDIKVLGQGVLKELPLVPHVINGIAEATTYVLCGVEEAISDVVSGIDDVPNILTQVIVDLLEFKGPGALANIPAGVINITEKVLKVGGMAVEDLVVNVEIGVDDLAVEVESGVKEIANDVAEIVSGVETEVITVVNAVDNALQTIENGVASGVGHVVHGVIGGLTRVVHLL